MEENESIQSPGIATGPVTDISAGNLSRRAFLARLAGIGRRFRSGDGMRYPGHGDSTQPNTGFDSQAHACANSRGGGRRGCAGALPGQDQIRVSSLAYPEQSTFRGRRGG